MGAMISAHRKDATKGMEHACGNVSTYTFKAATKLLAHSIHRSNASQFISIDRSKWILTELRTKDHNARLGPVNRAEQQQDGSCRSTVFNTLTTLFVPHLMNASWNIGEVK